jgi:LysM repeat protein
MTTRPSSSFLVCALAFAFVVAPIFLAHAQTATDASSTNAAPAAPAVAPAPAPADTNAAPATTTTERPATYTIAKGDSLWSIAHKYGTTVVKLRKLNNLKKGAILQPGQVLQMPPATSDTTTK